MQWIIVKDCFSSCVVRLWNLQTFTVMVCFKGHNYPVWSVEFRWVKEMIRTCGGFITLSPLLSLSSFFLFLFIFLLQSPLGFYFVTGSHDKTARVWSTDHIQPLRILAGHLSDVDVCPLQSYSIRAARSNLQMVRPSLMSVVKLSIICTRSMRQIWTYF